MKKLSKFRSTSALILAISIVISLMTASCSSNNTAKEENTAANGSAEVKAVSTQEQVETPKVKWDTSKTRKIVFSTISNYYTSGLKAAMEEYKKLHPENQIELEIIPDNETYIQNFNTKIAADKKTAPDIVHTNLVCRSTDTGEYIRKGYLSEMDSLLNDTNPYNGDKTVREGIDETGLKRAIGSSGQTGFLPFDLVGVAYYYNIDIFEKAGIKPPQTYEDLLAISQKLLDAGYKVPIGATPFSNYVLATLADSAFRKYTKDVIVMPGDGRYDEKTMKDNLDAKYDPNNESFDATIVMDPEKFWKFKKDYDRVSSPIVKRIYTIAKDLTKYYQKGYLTPDVAAVSSQFMAGEIPMYCWGSWEIGPILQKMKELPADKQFRWGSFNMPGLSDGGSDFEASVRSLAVSGHCLAIANKDDQDLYERAADFLKYMYSPVGAQMIFDVTLKAGEYVQGPSLIKGVKLSDELMSYLNGFVAGNFRAEWGDVISQVLSEDNPLTQDLTLKFYDGKITYEEFIKESEKYTQKYLDDVQKKFGYDGDPKTVETQKDK